MRVFFEQMFFAPQWYHYPVILLLFPLSLLYGIMMTVRRMVTSKKDFSIPIISVGNLIVGGSGKTPFVIALASKLEDVVIISRGYGRKSKGLIQVSSRGEILTDVTQSGDEPMLMAVSLPKASVIVSEDREIAIALAKEKGAKCIILDDGFNRVEIAKFEILLEPERISNYLPFPAGAFREFWFNKKYADIVAKEGESFTRQVDFENLRSKMLLVTAISNPSRLDTYLPEGIVQKVYLEDHAYFEEEKLKKLLLEYAAESLLVTQKDIVKMQGFKLPISQMKLKLEIKETIFTQVDEYIKGYPK
ncbi:MAG: tetraacyldisaccharide 4'-kinase [Sulfurovum sp.]|uniref:tetraacyldisaccharide 4'-kinase n=1 Tax=Sulfurovum sp. TaxID=1969726 RepID=UPI003C7851FE